MTEHRTETSYFQPVLDLLDYRPSVVEPVPDVVLVEGKSDFYLLRYAIDVLGLTPDLHLVPGTGAGTLDALIRLHIGWGSFTDRTVLLPGLCGDASVQEIKDLLDAETRHTIVRTVAGQSARATKKALHQAVLEL